MFIAQGFKKDSEFWKYLLGSLIVFIASIMGQVPLLLAILVKSFTSNKIPTAESDIYKLFEPNLLLFLILISFVFALVGLYFVVRKLHNQSFISIVTSRNKIDWKRVFFSFGLWAVIGVITTGIEWYLNPSFFQVNFNFDAFIVLFLIGIVLIPIQTSTEEYIFRGYLMQGFANLFHNKWAPLLMTSLIFGLLHWFNPEVGKMGNSIMIFYIGTGLFLGVITLMDDGMELALGFHAANNLIGALLVTSDWTAFQTNSILKDVSEPTLGFDVILPVVLIYPILLLIFGRKYKWNNWKEKLTGNIKI